MDLYNQVNVSWDGGNSWLTKYIFQRNLTSDYFITLRESYPEKSRGNNE
jgi:hypothetical protein